MRLHDTTNLKLNFLSTDKYNIHSKRDLERDNVKQKTTTTPVTRAHTQNDINCNSVMDKRFDVNLFDNKHNANDSFSFWQQFHEKKNRSYSHLSTGQQKATLIESINKWYFMRHFTLDWFIMLQVIIFRLERSLQHIFDWAKN